MVDPSEIETEVEKSNAEDSFAVWPPETEVHEETKTRDDQGLLDASVTVERNLSLFDRLDGDDVSSEGTDDDCDSVDMIGNEDPTNEYQPLVEDEAYGDFVEATATDETRNGPVISGTKVCSTGTEYGTVGGADSNIGSEAVRVETERSAYRSIEPLSEGDVDVGVAVEIAICQKYALTYFP
jgi:hypothetical protein